MQKVKTADLGSLFELVYLITTKDEANKKDFIDELRCRNGNLNITLVLGVNRHAALNIWQAGLATMQQAMMTGGKASGHND